MTSHIKDFSDYTDTYYKHLTLEHSQSSFPFQGFSSRLYSVITTPVYRWIFTLLIFIMYLLRARCWIHLPISLLTTYLAIYILTRFKFTPARIDVRKVLLPYEDKEGYKPSRSQEYEIWTLLTTLLFIIHILYTVDILPIINLYILMMTCGICYLDLRNTIEVKFILLAFKNKIL